MEAYVVNFNNGVKHEIENANLFEVKKIAEAGMSFTNEDVSIETLDGSVITVAQWWNVEPTEEDVVLTVIGKGHYQPWTDELE